MNSEFDNSEPLRRLLALKRHEQPPPGYFNDFSRQVIARIKAGEQGGREFAAGSWFQRFWTILEAKPVFAGMFGAAVCVLLVSGILSSEEAPMTPGMVSTIAVESPGALATHAALGSVDEPYAGQFIASTNPIAELFHQFQLKARPVSLTLPLPEGEN